MSPTTDELAALHLEALYRYDAAGHVLRVNAQIAAPRVHLFRTPIGNHWRFGDGCADAIRPALEAALGREPQLADCAELERRPPALETLRALLAQQAPPANEYRGPAFAFPDVIPPQAGAAAVEVVAVPQRLEAAGRLAWIREATDDERPLVVARDERGEVVAVCHSARTSALAAEAGVETAEASRRRGHGIAVVVAWAEAVRAGGRVPLYSTSWGNAASRALARRLGLICYGEDTHID